jgi:signal transduction histidine kinase
MALSLAVLLLTLVMTLPHAPARAAGGDPLVLNGPASMEVLGRHLEYTTDPDWQLKVTDFIAPSAVALKPLPGPVPDFGYTPARIWLKLDVVNRTARTDEWRFFFHTNFTQQIAVYRIGAKAEAATLLKLTEDSPFSARPIDNPQVVAPFGLARGEAATLIVSYYSQGASRLSMSVETPQSFDAQTLANNAKSYAFYGMMLVMIALAAVALAALRQPVFAAYTGYLISVLMYVAHADGAAFQYVWPDFPRFNSMASVVGGSGVMVFGGLFAITFLQTARYHGVMHRVLQAVVAAVVAIDVVLWATDPQLLKRLLVVMISVSALSYLTAGIVAAWTRFREVRFYLFAWIAGIIPALLITLRYGFGFEPAIITTYDSVRLALLFDALMMGLALFDSYNHLRRTATEETLAHAQRNAALGQRLATLEQRYAQVSAQALEREESVKDTVHDLRQPMHALRLSLRQMFSADAQKATDVGQIESALGYMERLVGERLAEHSVTNGQRSAKIAGEAGGAIEPGLHGVLRGAADMFASEAAEKGLELRLVLAAPDGRVAAYPLMRVVANLVSNAIKYTRQGRVLIALRGHRAGHRVEVHDTGPGLSGAAFEQALLRNQRLERDLASAEGSGLGLAVASEIADANGWAITACAGRKTGASIRVDLPAMSPLLQADGQLADVADV